MRKLKTIYRYLPLFLVGLFAFAGYGQRMTTRLKTSLFPDFRMTTPIKAGTQVKGKNLMSREVARRLKSPPANEESLKVKEVSFDSLITIKPNRQMMLENDSLASDDSVSISKAACHDQSALEMNKIIRIPDKKHRNKRHHFWIERVDSLKKKN